MTITVAEALDSDSAITVTIEDATAGGYVDGVYQKGATVSKKALASVQQPTPQQIENLEGGERVKKLLAFYLNKTATAGSNGIAPSTIIYRSKRYKVVQVGDWSEFGWFFAIGALEQ